MFVRCYGIENIINYSVKNKNDKLVCIKVNKYYDISQNNDNLCGYIYNEYFLNKYINQDNFHNIKEKAISSLNEILKLKTSSKVKVKTLILVLHGWGVDSSLYEDISKQLAFYGLVISPDFLGFGKSEKLDRVFTVNNYAETIIKLAGLFEYENLIVFGHSFGARVIFSCVNGVNMNNEIFKLYPSRIILTGAAGCKPKFSLVKYIKIKRYKYLKKKCKNNKKYTQKLANFGSNDYKLLNDDIMKKTFLNVVNFYQNHMFQEVKAKTLLIFGKNDKETPMYMANIMKKNIKNSVLLTLKNAGHFSFLDEPVLFNDNIVNFLGSG